MKKIGLILLLFLYTTIVVGVEHNSIIELKVGEKWWGVVMDESLRQPIFKQIEVGTHQFSSKGYHNTMMISSIGRYIWSDSFLSFDFDGKNLNIKSDNNNIKAEKGGKSLREAYLTCIHKNEAPSNNALDSELFETIIYDLTLELGQLCDQNAVISYGEKVISEGLPVGTLLIPSGWSTSGMICEFNKTYYPNPGQMITKLHELGFKVILEIAPYTKASGRGYVKGYNSESFLQNNKGEPIIITSDNGYYACYDVSKEVVLNKFKAAILALKEEYKIDGFKFGSMPTLDSTKVKVNIESLTYSWIDLSNSCKDNGIVISNIKDSVKTRVAGMLLDENTNYSTISSKLNDALAGSLIGYISANFTFCGDGRYEQISKNERLLTNINGLLLSMPIPTVCIAPWSIKDPKYAAQIKKAILFRRSITKYMQTIVKESEISAEPIIRHMEYQFPRKGFYDCDDQFMLGDQYMFAPILNEKLERTVRFPKGLWRDDKGNEIKGPIMRKVSTTESAILYYKLVK